MPILPKNQKCEALRCAEMRVEGSSYCQAHGGRVKISIERHSHNAAYKSKAWAQIRAAQLSRAPLCERCKYEGRIVQAAHVDHVFPWAVIGGDSFRRNLYASLCAPCHSVKTSIERRGVFLRYTEHGPIEYGANDYSRIVLGE
jgi:5-methylcytosine-specific restriction protein A